MQNLLRDDTRYGIINLLLKEQITRRSYRSAPCYHGLRENGSIFPFLSSRKGHCQHRDMLAVSVFLQADSMISVSFIDTKSKLKRT